MPADPLVRVRAQQTRSRATLERILTSAGQLFDEVGFEAATMDAIAIGAEVSIGSVYRFFNDKQTVDIDAGGPVEGAMRRDVRAALHAGEPRP